MTKLFIIGLKIILCLCLIILIGFNGYSLLLNQRNHTGFNPYDLIPVYILLGLLTLGFLVFSKYSGLKTGTGIYLVIFLVCLIGIFNVIAFDKLNIMMKYETWLEKGMPGKYEFETMSFLYMVNSKFKL